MTHDEQRFTFAVAALMGLISRGATPAEVRDTLWQYAEFAMNGKPNESNSNSD
jgi:predicted RNase H-like HicB family nuclease